jgi:hypothetical protein
MTFLLNKTTTILAGAVLMLSLSAQADTVNVTFAGPSGVSDGTDYVLPYLLTVNGTQFAATCYDIFDEVSGGQSWTANELTVNEAATTGQFSADANALSRYEEVGFLSQQTTSSAQNQVDLQHDIWNIFAPGTYSVTTGMQAYLDLLTTPAYTDFSFGSVRFLEDVNQTTGRAQAFVIDPPTATPEPETIVLTGAGMLLLGLIRVYRSQFELKQVRTEDTSEQRGVLCGRPVQIFTSKL